MAVGIWFGVQGWFACRKGRQPILLRVGGLFRVQGWFEVWDLEIKVEGLGFGIWGLKFRV